MNRTTWLVLPIAALLSAPASAQTADPAMGTWKLNIEKSSFPFGQPPKSQTLTMEPAGKGVKFTNETVDTAGRTVTVEWTANFDGKGAPIKGNPGADTVSLKRANARNFTQTNSKNGEVGTTLVREISPDGRTMMTTASFHNRLVYLQSSNSPPPKTKDPSLGTWDLSVEKSRFLGAPPQSATITLEAEGKGVRFVETRVGPAGQPIRWEYAAGYDGRDYPMKGNSAADMVSLQRVNAQTVKQLYKKGGQVVSTQTRELSKDGKSMTATVLGYQRTVHEKQ